MGLFNFMIGGYEKVTDLMIFGKKGREREQTGDIISTANNIRNDGINAETGGQLVGLGAQYLGNKMVGKGPLGTLAVQLAQSVAGEQAEQFFKSDDFKNLKERFFGGGKGQAKEETHAENKAASHGGGTTKGDELTLA